MSAQVAQVLQIIGTFSARGRFIGRLSKSLFYLIGATGTFTGNPDNEYRVKQRHRRCLSQNLGTLHCPLQRTGT